jgi:hypothetical protein
LAASPSLQRKAERRPRSQSSRPLERYLCILKITAGFSGDIDLSRLSRVFRRHRMPDPATAVRRPLQRRHHPHDRDAYLSGLRSERTMDKFIIFEKREDIAVITFNRPAILNAWHAPMRLEITERLKQCNADPAVRALTAST